jgi:hypothetical protein
VVRVTRQTLIRSAATGLWKNRKETAFYVSSVMLSAETFASVSTAEQKPAEWRRKSRPFRGIVF